MKEEHEYIGWIIPEEDAATGVSRFHCEQFGAEGKMGRLATFLSQEEALSFWDTRAGTSINLLPTPLGFRVYRLRKGAA
jgi:hypothetical protein